MKTIKLTDGYSVDIIISDHGKYINIEGNNNI